MSSNLVLHKGALRATYEEVSAIETPKRTRTWSPISHVDIIGVLKEQIAEAQFKIRREEYGLTPEGNRLFGVFDLESEVDGYGYAIGFRNSHNKSLAAGVTAGARVFVCDNLAFNGDYSLKKKHTRNNDFLLSLEDFGDVLPGKLSQLTDNMSALKEEYLEDDEAKLLVFSAYEKGAISSSKIGQVWEEYLNPTYGEFEDRTKHNLLMAFTEIAKKESSILQLEKLYRQTGSLFFPN